MSQPPPLVETVALTKRYEQEVTALDDVNLTIRAGEFVAVMGPSGSGKSTLLNMLAALDRPTSGDVRVAGVSLATCRDLDRHRSQTVGLVFQLHNLIPTLTARENVEVPMHAGRLRRPARRTRAETLLASVGLAGRGGQLPSQLSGGERQRVAIARALANQPPLLLADEPTGNLDSNSSAEVMAVLRQLNRDLGTTVLVVTHDPAVARLAGRVVTLIDGRIVRDELVANPYVEDLRQFKASQLGQALLSGTIPEAARDLGLGPLLPSLRQVLSAI